MANELGLVHESLWLEKAEGKQSVLYGPGPGAPDLRDPSSVLVGSCGEILKFEFKRCCFCDRGELRACEARAPIPGSPWPSCEKPCPAQGRTEQGMAQQATGEMEKSSSVRPGPCQPLEQERGRREPGEAECLGKHSWRELPDFHGDWTVQNYPLQDCPSSIG